MKSHVQLGLGLLVGLGLGLLAAATQSPHLLWFTDKALRPVGTVFINLLTMVVIPLVASSVFVGVAELGDPAKLGRLGLRTLGFFWGTGLVAVAAGLITAMLILPLAPLTAAQQEALRSAALADSAVVQPAMAGDAVLSGTRFIVELIPRSPLEAAVRGALLPVIVFVTIFAVATASLPAEKRELLTQLADTVTQGLIKVVRWVLVIAPVGIAALVAPPVAQSGLALVRSMAVFILAVLVGLVLFFALVLLPAAAVVGRLRPGRFLKAILPSCAMGLSTTSSLATLPTMLDAAIDDLKVSRTVGSFVLPLGASLNRPGSALYQAVAVVFMAQLYGAPLGPGEVGQAGAAVFLASLTVASIPSASVLSLAPAFTAVGIPLPGLGLLIALDRIPDMFRTATNVAGHLTGSVIIAASEGEQLG